MALKWVELEKALRSQMAERGIPDERFDPLFRLLIEEEKRRELAEMRGDPAPLIGDPALRAMVTAVREAM